MIEAVTVRRLDSEDLQPWKEIRRSALETTPTAFGRTLTSFLAQSDSDHRQKLSGSVVFGAFIQGNIVGSAGWYPVDYQTESHRGKVNSVFVRPAYRRQGIAAKLMQYIIADAKRFVLQLELSVTVGQDRAIGFYRRQGFDIVGTIPRALCHDGVFSDEHLMVRNLDA